ncbi:MAG: hypothetical protein C4530_10420 [Desulfobacteraceae bacterium]|nr:MAG: hypothetical protein C4530_10420 [Desulfobacteraceae bacterium]
MISAPATEGLESSFHFMLGDSPAGIERLNGIATLIITIGESLKNLGKSFHPLANNPVEIRAAADMMRAMRLHGLCMRSFSRTLNRTGSGKKPSQQG